MAVDAVTAEWLSAPASVVVRENLPTTEVWGDLATVSEIVSPLANKADAEEEAAREIAFLQSATVVEKVEVSGRRHDLVGRLLDVTTAVYDGEQRVLVLAAEPGRSGDRTTLTVLRRLA